MLVRRLWTVLLMVLAPLLCLASVKSVPARDTAGQISLSEREHMLWTSAVHGSEFAAMTHPASRPECEAAQPPQALATPDPVLDGRNVNAKVSVSFIIGIDGRVHSALILESAGPSEDRTILEAVRFWRYRPAMCNGVPTEAEAKVEFSSR
jgi:TonB family protein